MMNHVSGVQRLASIFLAGCVLVIFAGAPIFAVAQKEPGVNLAVVAVPSASYVSGDTTLDALNNGSDPRNSQDRRQRAYGNWPHRGTEWAQYEWSLPITTKAVDVYWWNDNRGVRTPQSCRLLYWDGEAFVPVNNVKGLGIEESQYNRTTFDEIQTTKLRLEIESTKEYSTGILEWKVYDSGRSPVFPPIVKGDMDRVVMVGGQTWLSGTVQTLGQKNAPELTCEWTKTSGPGTVTFSDPKALKTTAQMDQTGEYVLSLTARQGDQSSQAAVKVSVRARPPQKTLDLIDTEPYRIDSPLWNHRTKALIVNWIPHCIQKISDPDLKEGGINNFIEVANKLAGKPHGEHRGYVFSNAWVYNIIESICLAQMIDPQGDAAIIEAQQAMLDTLEDWIPKILAAQEPDGYIQTCFTLSDRTRWTPRYRADHEGYVAGYFLEAAIAHYLLTDGKDDRLYRAAKRLADCWDAHIGPAPKQEWFDGHQAMEMGLVRFGRFVNDVEGDGRGDRYIQLGKFLLDCRRDGSSYDQSHVPVIQQYEAVGHAVRASYSYAAMSDVAMETGNIDYQSAVASLWESIVNRKYYVIGGIGSGETSEGFGPDYSLRHNGYNEACSSCGLLFFQHKLNMATHDARYADLYEETLYNALLGSVDLEGKNFYYQNPLTTNSFRYPWHGCPCCVGNIPRVLLMLPTWMYLKDADGVYVNLFIGSASTVRDLAGTDVELIQETDYPWSGNVSIRVKPRQPAPFAVRIRMPDRSVSDLYTPSVNGNGLLSLRVNGEPVPVTLRKGYAEIQRLWKSDDRIDCELPMPIQRVRGMEAIEATRGQVALRIGPLIYTVENVDQELGQLLAPDAPLRTEWKADLLGGVNVITGQWSNGAPLTAIPYYARANRRVAGAADGDGTRTESSVWIQEQ